MGKGEPGMKRERLAVVDMGSNSFHLLIAERCGERWQHCYSEERKVQLAANRRGATLCPEAMVRGLSCLEIYWRTMGEYEVSQVRIVATASLRGADCGLFIEQVAQLCGVRPRVLNGDDEARLVYRGVCGDFADEQHYLVVDIGGGSTELALGRGRRLLARHRSFPVGCLGFLRYFPNGELSQKRFDDAYAEAKKQFSQFRSSLPVGALGVLGSSGSLLAVEAVLQRLSLSEQGIRRKHLAVLAADITRFEHLGEVHYGGLSEDRREVFASGLAIVCGLFDGLGLEQMALSPLGLREGVMNEWLAELSQH
jgi:exopolyphosphatase / guanosine-5'-triphosphate,3'-diphosphate pyrophosphatase